MLALLAVVVLSQKPVLTLGASRADIEQFLKGGVKWGDPSAPHFQFGADGKGNHHTWWYPDGNGMESVDCDCVAWATPVIKDQQLALTCTKRCLHSYSCNYGPKRCATRDVDSEESERVVIEVLHASANTLVFTEKTPERVQGGRTTYLAVVSDCGGTGPRTCTEARFDLGDITNPSRRFTLELIPAATERALFDSVKTKVQSSEALKLATLFEGPVAKKARETTEIFYANGHQADATDVAADLSAIVGKVEVKPWPGPWNFDVIVVVGARAR